jgi:accessory gene regulator B
VREFVVKKMLNFIQKSGRNYSQDKIQEIKYGLESLYILITKSIIIFGIALILGILEDLLIFILFYNLIKLPSFGVHAGKSWICLLSSLLLFIGLPLLSKTINISFDSKCWLGIICLVSMFVFAPAATKKHPLIGKKRIVLLKYISTILALIYIISSLAISNIYIGNNIILALLLQSFIISPLAYKLFKQQYIYTCF